MFFLYCPTLGSHLNLKYESVPLNAMLLFQVKYKEAGKKEVSSSLYSKLPETLETKHAKDVSQLQSQVPHLLVRLNMLSFQEDQHFTLKTVENLF